MYLRILKLHPEAIIPRFQHPGDSGMDLHAIEAQEIVPKQATLIKTGLAVEIPVDTELQIRPRSGLALKHCITVLNSPGTIDANYRGELGVILINHGDRPFQVTVGMRIAQMVMVPIIKPKIEVVETLNSTSRGSGGFGSTGT